MFSFLLSYFAFPRMNSIDPLKEPGHSIPKVNADREDDAY